MLHLRHLRHFHPALLAATLFLGYVYAPNRTVAEPWGTCTPRWQDDPRSVCYTPHPVHGMFDDLRAAGR